ncbi:hypothetical protein CEXT_687721 [Caerostris extrusa]|uniref:Uncharacterized protein n=1 Tax=Caerostris extrusa TaxID=172846 RepID=A0AAV4TNY0_CAEEX|nr:hypothetical protein CEXT_687721 [Caerostris extrusa]
MQQNWAQVISAAIKFASWNEYLTSSEQNERHLAGIGGCLVNEPGAQRSDSCTNDPAHQRDPGEQQLQDNA